MSHSENINLLSRRELGVRAGRFAAASALTGIAIPAVHAAGDSTVQVALVGCGGRGTGAAGEALKAQATGVKQKLVAMADAFKDRLDTSHKRLTGDAALAGKVDVPQDRRFVGFEAYKQAMDALKPGDVVICATPLAFRAQHFAYAIEKGLHVFMEKPLSADGPMSRRLLELGQAADKKNLKVAVGLMSRHARHMQELHQRIADGQIGDIVMMRGYRMHGPAGTFRSTPKPPEMTELEFQIRRFHGFLWSGGGCFSDFNIHHIDHLCWMKNAWPVKAIGVGGRHYKQAPDGTPYVDQNFDSYGIEYTFEDGAKLLFDGRYMEKTPVIYSSYVHGTKGFAVASKSGDCGPPASIHKGQSIESEQLWRSTDRSSPYQNEWNDLMDAIAQNKPYSELKRGVEASLVTSMGRMAAHTGLEVTFDQMLNSDHEFAPNVDKLTSKDSPAPLQADAKGMYPQPEPGRKTREY